MGVDRLKTFEEGDFFPCERLRHQRIVRRLLQSDPGYAAMIHSLDENIGRLLVVLKETGKEDDTVVIFTSDNGGLATAQGSPTCNAPLAEGKGWRREQAGLPALLRREQAGHLHSPRSYSSVSRILLRTSFPLHAWRLGAIIQLEESGLRSKGRPGRLRLGEPS
jgi:hypothetical protein